MLHTRPETVNGICGAWIAYLQTGCLETKHEARKLQCDGTLSKCRSFARPPTRSLSLSSLSFSCRRCCAGISVEKLSVKLFINVTWVTSKTVSNKIKKVGALLWIVPPIKSSNCAPADRRMPLRLDGNKSRGWEKEAESRGLKLWLTLKSGDTYWTPTLKKKGASERQKSKVVSVPVDCRTSRRRWTLWTCGFNRLEKFVAQTMSQKARWTLNSCSNDSILHFHLHC